MKVDLGHVGTIPADFPLFYLVIAQDSIPCDWHLLAN